MVKSKITRIGIIVSGFMIIIGVILMIYLLNDEKNENVIKIDIQNGDTKTVVFEDLCIVPGGKSEYTLTLVNNRAQTCELSLDFNEEVGDNSLKNFAYVRMEAGENVICDMMLADAIEGEILLLPVDFSEKKNTDIKIVYYLPLEVGNEAQGAEASFDLIITASNE